MRRWYGAGPLHLLALIVCGIISGYTIWHLIGVSSHLWALLIWFVGAAILHDLVLFPVYAILDRSAFAAVRRRRSGQPLRPTGVPVINYLRVPLGMAALLLGIWFPLILQTSRGRYIGATGLTPEVYLGRFLEVLGALMLLSLIAYVVRLARLSRRAP